MNAVLQLDSTKPCPSHPDGLNHECMTDEMRCVYCGARLAPYNCHGCGRFLTTHELRENETRCEGCT